MNKRKVFTHIPDPATNHKYSVKSFDNVTDHAFKPKYVMKKLGMVVLPPVPMHYTAPEKPADPPQPKPVRLFALRTPPPCTPPCTPPPPVIVAPPAKPVETPRVDPGPPVGSRAWKIHQFIKANFKS